MKRNLLLSILVFCFIYCTVSAQTIATGTPPAWICPPSQVGSVNYTVTGTYNPGNVFTAQLSVVFGGFGNPLSVGSAVSTGSGSINFQIPANTTAGSNYRLRVVSSNPAITGTASTTFT